LAITARPITLTATDRTKVYGDTLNFGTSAFTKTAGTYANSEVATAMTLTSANGYAASTTRAVGTNANEVVPTAATGTDGFLASNYDITYVSGSLAITARPITLTATDRTKVYGDALNLGTSAFTKTAGTYANSELATAVTLTSANSYAASTTRAVGTNNSEVVPSTATGTGSFLSSNYDITYVSGSLAITARPITLTATNRTKVYGDALSLGTSAFSKTAGTYANSELATAVTLTSANSYDASTTQSVNAGYANEVVPTSATGTAGFLASNYDITYTSGSLAITARPITLVASNRTKIYGNSLTLGNSLFTHISGTFANSEVATAVTLTSANGYAASTTRAVGTNSNEVVPTSATGTGGFLASNYDITYTAGSLEITARPITLTADNRTKVYGNSLTLGTNGFAHTAGTFANSELATAVTLTSANGYAASTTRAVGTNSGEVVPSTAIGTGGFLASNYDITYAAGSLAITARPITLTADNRTKVYGDTLSLGTSAFTKTAGTFANSELATAVTLTSANSYDASTTRAVGTNANEVVPTSATGTGGFLASNYDITYVSGSLAITARPITLTADNRTKVYGNSLILGTTGFTHTAGTFANSELATAVTLTSTNGYAASTTQSVNTAYANEIAPTSATGTGGFLASNYDITYTSGSLAITARPITLTATNRTKVYGDTLTLGTSAFTKTAGTFANSESATAVTLTSANSYDASTTQAVNTGYANEVVPTSATGTGGFLASNYNITYVSGSLAITARPITLTADNRTKVYGNSLTLGTTGFTKTAGTYANSESATAVTLTSTNSYDASTTQAVNTGYVSEVVPTSATGTGGFLASNYDITYVSGSLAITARPITLTANNRTKVYGDTLSLGTSAFTKTAGTFANSESATAVTLTSANSYDASSTQAVNAGYTNEVVPTSATGTGGFLASNYEITYVSGSLAITARPITLVATNRTKVYGDALTLGNTAFTHTAGTFANSELATAVTLTSVNGYAASTTRAVGINSSEVVPSAATGTGGFLASNYDITYTPADLAVTVRPISITADNRTKVYGDVLTLGNSAFTKTAGTYANSESATAVTLASANGYSASTTHSVSTNTNEVVPSSAIGTGGFLASNYAITYLSGSLEVTARPISLTADNRTKTYGDTLSLGTTGFTKTAGTFANSELATAVTLTSANSFDASTTRAVGTNANEVVPTAATGTGGFLASNYNITYVSGSLAITARPITLTADNRTKIYGNTLSLGNAAFTKTAGTFANTELATAVTLSSANSYASSTTQAVNAGYANEVVPTAATGTGGFLASNYDITYVSGSLAITARSITLTADNRTKVYGNTLSLGNTGFTHAAGTFANSELATAVTLTSANSYDASTTRAVGTNANEVVPSAATGSGGFLASNYDITYTSGNLAITARPITLTADNRTKVYGNSLTLGTTGFTKTAGTFANNELATAVTLSSTNSYDASTTRAVGTYSSEVVPTAATGTGGFLASNYDITYTSGSLAITARPITLTADNRTKVYGDVLTLGTTGFTKTSGTYANSESATAVTLTSTNGYAASTTQAVNAGYVSEVAPTLATGTGGFLASNYDITYTSGNLVITARPITLTATNRTKVYGDTLSLGTSAFTKTAGTYANSESATAVTLTSANSYDASTTQAVNAGYVSEVVPTSATGTGGFLASNYDITYTSGNLAITARPITLTADNRTKVYGDVLTLGTTGFTKTSGTYANSEIASAVLLSSANAYAASTTQAANSSYINEVVPSAATGTGGFLASNYDITYLPNNLAITTRPITLVADNRTKIYGDNLSLGTSSFAKTAGTYANSELATAVTLTSANGHAGNVAQEVGTYSSQVVPSAATGTGGFLASNYDITYTAGSLAITQKALTITSNDQTTTYGTALALGTSRFTSLGLINTDAISAVTLQQNNNTTTPALQENGTYQGAINGILASNATGTGLSNYAITYVPGKLTIDKLNTVTWTGAGGDSNWSTAANWTNNTTPLRSNVLNVVIPARFTVNFDTVAADNANKPTSRIANSSNLMFNLNADFTLSNVISGSGSINQQGTGTLTISGNNTAYTGNTQINTSRLHLANSRALGSGSLVSSGGGLSMDGAIELPSLNVNGNLILHSGIYTTGSQTYNGNLELAANGNTRLDTTNSNITFNGTITAGINSKANQRSLLINAGTGTVVFNERVGSDRGLYANFNNNNTNLYTLRVTAGRIEIKADILTFENQIYNGPVFIGSNGTNGTTRTLISVDPSIVFNSTIDDINPTTPTHTLEAKAIAVDYSMTPILEFNGDIGGDQPLASLVSITGTQLTTSGTQVGDVSSNPVRYNGNITIGGSVTTSGDQSYTSNQITLGSTSNQQQVFKTTDNGNLDFNIGIQPNSIQINNSISNHELVIDLGRGNLGASTETALATAGITFKEILPFVSGIDIHSDITRQKMALATAISESDDLVADVNIGDLDEKTDESECDVKTDDKCSL
jgi:hypothetical protein